MSDFGSMSKEQMENYFLRELDIKSDRIDELEQGLRDIYAVRGEDKLIAEIQARLLGWKQ